MASSKRRVASMASAALAFILQRTPILSHFCLVLLGILGPVYAPITTSLTLVFIHVVFLACQTRSFWGMLAAYWGTLKHSRVDWPDHYQRERNKIFQRDGECMDVLDYRHVQHVIIVPAYKEDVSTLRETLDVLASHPLAQTSYRVCLGMEEREAGAVAKAQALIEHYQTTRRSFVDMTFSLHPGNIVGESAGKASNVNWAARYMATRLPEREHSNTIVNVLDADTLFAADFFLGSAVKFALAPASRRAVMMFVPPTLFDRNCAEVPIFTRAADIFWCCAGMGGIYPSSWCKIPTSAYGVSLELVKYTNFWDCGPEAIGEDMHFYCKAMFETKGNVYAETVYSPASQCNVVGGPGNGAVSSYVNDMRARWSQACRHLWGSLDFGYCYHRFLTGAIGQTVKNTDYMTLTEEDEELDETPYLEKGSLPMKQISIEDAHVDLSSPTSSVGTDTTAVEEVPEFSLPSGKVKLYEDFHDGIVVPTPRRAEEDDALLLTAQSEPCSDDTLKMRWMPMLSILARLYEAHLMLAHVTILMSILRVYPSVVHRNGHMSWADPWARHCTMGTCTTAFFSTPFASSADVPSDLAPGMQPAWMMPDIIICAVRLANILGMGGILATVCMCATHDFYHRAGAFVRWQESNTIFSRWQQGSIRTPDGKPPARYLGMEPPQRFQRKWPKALLDFAAVPSALLYGVFPMIYAQTRHLWTVKLTYVVSAKGKSVIVAPQTADAVAAVNADACIRQSLDAVRSRPSEDVIAFRQGAVRQRTSINA
ncbi:hypothetical protein OC846_003429 [Tilletia horrida]|uniref:Glycosyltransferase 2-like domain-containing protein n=1 Tax=Tilletia horrida TaxID=155126 RepID=A0AAN6JS15_9BASI|nr:hypothetical protein OC846_003429 [Tilletia horrida]